MNAKHLSPEEIKTIITSPNLETRNEFVSAFSKQISTLCDMLSSVHGSLNEMYGSVPRTERSEIVGYFLYSAFDCLVSAAHLLIFGHSLPAGNLMRCWFEAVSMAVLCSNKHADIFEKFMEDPDGIRVNAIIGETFRNNKKAEVLGCMREELVRARDRIKFYNRHSHTSAYAVSFRQLSYEPGKVSLAGEYDSGKKEYYQEEMSEYKDMIDLTLTIIKFVEVDLNEN